MGHDGHDHHHPPHHHHHEATASASTQEHRRSAPASVSAYVVTCSDSREGAADKTGALIRRALEQAGHVVAGTLVIPDDAQAIRGALEKAAELGARAVIVNGGTGLSKRDVTVETLGPLLERTLPGFGELFRMLSFQQVGPAAMLSRALAGTVRDMVVFALPGSPAAAELAMTRLIVPELGHLVRELSR